MDLLSIPDQSYLTWSTGGEVLKALAMYRRSIASSRKHDEQPAPGGGWSRWWRKGQPLEPIVSAPETHETHNTVPGEETANANTEPGPTHYAKTLRLSSEQLVGCAVWEVLTSRNS